MPAVETACRLAHSCVLADPGGGEGRSGYAGKPFRSPSAHIQEEKFHMRSCYGPSTRERTAAGISLEDQGDRHQIAAPCTFRDGAWPGRADCTHLANRAPPNPPTRLTVLRCALLAVCGRPRNWHPRTGGAECAKKGLVAVGTVRDEPLKARALSWQSTMRLSGALRGWRSGLRQRCGCDAPSSLG